MVLSMVCIISPGEISNRCSLKIPIVVSNERPEYEAEQTLFSPLLPFVVKIIESLLHGLSKFILESSRVENEEFFVEYMDFFLAIYHRQTFMLIAIWNTQKTGHLVNELAS